MKENSFPLISIITVVFNGENQIEKTISSVIDQIYPNIEYIIVDGGSSDNTNAIISRYHEKINSFISEPDNGVFDAMNKGILRAKGKWINFMNAGDTFVNKYSVSHLFKNSETLENFSLIYADRLYPNGEIKKAFKKEIIEGGIICGCHQSMFFNAINLKEILKYDLQYKIYSDFDLVSKIYKKDKDSVFYFPHPIAVYEGGGISFQPIYTNLKRKEKYRIVFKRFGLIGVFKAIYYRFKNI